VRVEDEALEPLARALVVTDRQPLEPSAAMRYDVLGRAVYTVLEEGDRVASELTGLEAVKTIAQRSRARLMDHLALGGWMAARAGIAWIDGRRSLVLTEHDPGPATCRPVGSDDVEGDELVFFRGGEAVCLPQPGPRSLRLAPLERVVLVGEQSVAGPVAPISSGDAVRTLVAATVMPSAPRARLVAECVTLVGRLEAYRVTQASGSSASRSIAWGS
jgi:hypothetical protein